MNFWDCQGVAQEQEQKHKEQEQEQEDEEKTSASIRTRRGSDTGCGEKRASREKSNPLPLEGAILTHGDQSTTNQEEAPRACPPAERTHRTGEFAGAVAHSRLTLCLYEWGRNA